jgi:hypothetical protein
MSDLKTVNFSLAFPEMASFDVNDRSFLILP